MKWLLNFSVRLQIYVFASFVFLNVMLSCLDISIFYYLVSENIAFAILCFVHFLLVILSILHSTIYVNEVGIFSIVKLI